MLLRAVRNQLIHDLKASWQKSLLLGSLLVVGLCFWIPPLYRAVAGNTNRAQAESTTTPPASSEALAAARAASAGHSPAARERGITWENAEELLATDPLVRSAELAAVTGHPFEVSADQFSPPVLISEEEPENARKTSTATSTPKVAGEIRRDEKAAAAAIGHPVLPSGPKRLVLKSTILGSNRRAALINDTLYSEGSTIQLDGESYLLAAVRSKQVELRKGEQVLTLDLPSLSASEGIRIERVESPRVQSP